MMFKKCLYILTVLAAMFCSTCWSANDPVDFSWSGEWNAQSGKIEFVVPLADRPVPTTITNEVGTFAAGCGTDLDVYDYKTGGAITQVISKKNGDVTVSWSVQSAGSDVKCGVFANGDPWIAPADGESSVTITGLTVTGPGQDGIFADENPQIESMGLLPNRNGRDYGMYNANETLTFPTTYAYPTTLLAAVRSSETTLCGTDKTEGNCVAAYGFLTLLSGVPETFGRRLLRPAADEINKLLVNIDTDMDWSIWPSRPDLTGVDDAEMRAIINRWNHTTEIMSLGGPNGEGYSEGGRAYRPEDIIDDYSAGRGSKLYTDIFALLSDDRALTDPLKTQALASILTNSMDTFFGIHECTTILCYKAREWKSGAGQWLARGPQSALWATMMLDNRYSNAMKMVPSYAGTDNGAYQEIEQLNQGEHGTVWGDGQDNLTGTDTQETVLRYWAEQTSSPCREQDHDNCPESATTIRGQRNKRDPHLQIDGPPAKPAAIYASVIGGNLRSFAILMEMIPGLKETVNYGDTIENFVVRLHYNGAKTLPDKCAPIDPDEDPLCDVFKSNSTGHKCKFWGYKSTTGIATWGPDPEDPTLVQCIQNSTIKTRVSSNPDVWVTTQAQPGDSNYGQNGRFAWYDGAKVDVEYKSPQAESIFETIFPNPSN